MLTSLFRSKTILGLFLTYVLSGLLVGTVWYLAPNTGSVSELLSTHWAFAWAEQLATLIPIIGIVLASGAALLARVRFREIKETLGSRNLSTLAFASIIASQHKPLLARPDLIAASLVLIAVFMLIFFTYKKDSALSEIFHVGLGVGLASLFVGQSILLVISVAFSLLMLRTGSMKEWIVFLLGLGMTAIFISLVVVWTEDPVLSFKRVIQSAWIAQVSVSSLSIGNLVLLVLIALSFTTVLSNITAGTVHLRNISLVNLGWVAGVVLTIVILGVDWQAGLVLAAFPISQFISKLIESINRWWIADILLLLLIAAPILSILLPL